jgi:hypothetical protein
MNNSPFLDRPLRSLDEALAQRKPRLIVPVAERLLLVRQLLEWARLEAGKAADDIEGHLIACRYLRRIGDELDSLIEDDLPVAEEAVDEMGRRG